MKLTIKIKPNARNNKIEKKAGDVWTVRIKAPARENKANEELINFLAKEFEVPKSYITIVRGHTARTKILEII